MTPRVSAQFLQSRIWHGPSYPPLHDDEDAVQERTVDFESEVKESSIGPTPRRRRPIYTLIRADVMRT
jgi:hypothetical protein